MEPRTWLPDAAGSMRAPTAAEEPLDDPPAVLRVSNGLRVGGGAPAPNSVVVVLPRITAPPRRNAKTCAESRLPCQPVYFGLFIWVGISTVSYRSLTPNGMPSTRDSAVPALYRAVDASAAARAPSMFIAAKAFTALSSASTTSKQRSR